MNRKENAIYNLTAIGRYRFMVNAFVLALLTTIWGLVLPAENMIGVRNNVALNILFSVSVIVFMMLFEKFSSFFLQWSENVVINILSCVYAFVLLIIINAIMFMPKTRILSDIAMFLSAVGFLNLADFLILLPIKIKSIVQKPKLLVIGSDNKTFMRMKRIKYGAMDYYDSWYEKIGNMDSKSIDLRDIRFEEFDAVCVLNGLSTDEYEFVIKEVTRLGKDLFVVPDMVDAGMTNSRVVRFDDVLALYMPKYSISKGELIIKRFFDIVLSAIGLVVAAIPMLVIAVAIKLTSPGPVFYKQERMTLNKKRFMIYKFRTMIADAEKLTGPKFAEKDDPRITKIGKILRSCRLDELPQIINILKGDMSIVGPRPERPVFIEQFEKEIENYNYRFSVKAGLTSLSHVYGKYSTYIHDRTYYDLYYITNFSLLLDFKIILLTTKTIFMKSAAEGEDLYKDKTQATAVSNTENEMEGVQK